MCVCVCVCVSIIKTHNLVNEELETIADKIFVEARLGIDAEGERNLCNCVRTQGFRANTLPDQGKHASRFILTVLGVEHEIGEETQLGGDTIDTPVVA